MAQPIPRGPGFVHTGVGVVLLLLFAAMLLTVPTSPPPAIAEIAPQAVEQIEEAPPEQASDAGTGAAAGDNGTDGPTGGTGPGAPAAPVEVGRVKRCVAEPGQTARQIEDPQSPPCVPYWDPQNDNGGATYKGVTAREIRIAVPSLSSHPDVYLPLFSFFNRRFQFYGRTLVPLDLPPGAGDPAGSRASAKRADEELRVFASLENAASTGGFHYMQELARRKVIAVTPRALHPEPYLQRYQPYLWQYAMSTDRIFANVGQWACRRLAGHPAARAAGVAPSGGLLAEQRRKFGVILTTDFPDVPIDVEPLVRELRACGEEPVVELPLADTSDARYTDISLRMKEAGVTTVLCQCGGTPNAGRLVGAFNSQNYLPEWQIGTYYLFDDNGQIGVHFPSQNRDQVIGLTFQPLDLAPGKHPADWALEEEGAELVTGDAFFYSEIDRFYHQLLLLASGIQMAGPNLTPTSFARGLHSTVFPNPETSIKAGKVGFGGGSHSMTLDGAEFWWDNAARSPYPAALNGALCYVDGGTRHTYGGWPEGVAGNPFTRPCRTGPA